MSGAETPHTVQYAQHCNWPVGLTDVPKDWLPVANAKCLHLASPAGLVPQPLGYPVAITKDAYPIEVILFGTVGSEVQDQQIPSRSKHRGGHMFGRSVPRNKWADRRTVSRTDMQPVCAPHGVGAH